MVCKASAGPLEGLSFGWVPELIVQNQLVWAVTSRSAVPAIRVSLPSKGAGVLGGVGPSGLATSETFFYVQDVAKVRAGLTFILGPADLSPCHEPRLEGWNKTHSSRSFLGLSRFGLGGRGGEGEPIAASGNCLQLRSQCPMRD